MTGLPDTRFYLDDGTGTFPINVTSYARLMDGYSFTRGRSDTETSPTSGTMSATLNNGVKGAVGAFTPGSTLLHSPSVIALDARIRVKEIINGSTFNRYTGYVKSWAVGWPDGVENTAIVRIQCSDAQERAERRILRSAFEEECFSNSVGELYLLNEPATALTSADTSGNQADPLTQLGNAPAVTYSGTEATFAAGRYLNVSTLTLAAPLTMLFKFKTSTASQSFFRLGSLNVDITGGNFAVYSGSVLQGSLPFTPDGVYHVFAVKFSSTANMTMYLDGTIIYGPGAFSPTWTSGAVSLGANSSPNLLVTYTGTMSLVGLFPSALADATVAALSSIALNGLPTESDNARLTRLAGYAGIPVGTLDTSLTNVPFTDFTGRTAWDCIQEVADASMGVAYIDGSGNLVFHNRQKVTTKTSPDLTLSASFVTFDAEPTTDGQDLLNYMEVTASATGVPQVARDTVSEYGDATHQAHGRYPDSKELLLSSDPEALDRANWLIKTRSQPSSSGRYGTLTVNLYGMSATQQSSVVQNLEPGCWLRVVSMPAQTPGGTTVDLVVEGIAPTQTGNAWTITCNVVSKTAIYPKVFILDSSLLDGPDLLAV